MTNDELRICVIRNSSFVFMGSISMSTNRRAFYLAAGLAALYAVNLAIRQKRRYDVAGKSVLITGGSRGLGLLVAREFASRGARIAVCSRNERELSQAREDLARSGTVVATAVCDIAKKEDVDRMLDEVQARIGPIDVLVNNAGIIQVGPLEVMTLDDFKEAMGIHFWGPLYTTLGVLPGMMRRREGRIVNISSIGGKIAVPHMLPYSASKFALTGLSEGLRPELARHNIAVTTVCPGLMRTGSPKNAIFKGQHRSEYAWFSIADSLPGLSMNAMRAARQVVDACIAGDAEIVLSLPAKIAVKFHGIFPGLTQDVLEMINLFLPKPGGIGTGRALGSESRSKYSPSWLTTLNEEAARPVETSLESQGYTNRPA
jgi:short-subunit dehydrogenase